MNPLLHLCSFPFIPTDLGFPIQNSHPRGANLEIDRVAIVSSHNASLHSLTTDLRSYDFYPQTLSFYLDSTWNSNPLTDKPDHLLSVGARLDLSMPLNMEVPSSPCFPPLVPVSLGCWSSLAVVLRCPGPLSFHSAVSLGRPPPFPCSLSLIRQNPDMSPSTVL